MIWAKRQFLCAEYASYLNRLAAMRLARPSSRQFMMMVALKTGGVGEQDIFVAVPESR